MKIFYCDLETTGVDPKENGIIQIAGTIEIDGEQKEEFNFLVQPFPKQIVSKEALKVNGRTLEEIREFDGPRSVYSKLIAMISKYVDKFNRADKFYFIAYNAKFDMDFLREFFTRNGDTYFGSWFYYPYLCVMELAAWHLIEDRPQMINFKLTTVAKHLGIEFDEDEAHDGLFDVRLTKQIQSKLEEMAQ